MGRPYIVDPEITIDELNNIFERYIGGDRPTDAELLGFPYEIYRFIIQSIRDRDQDTRSGGVQLLERFLRGPQEIWWKVNEKYNTLPDIFDPDDCPTDFLTGLRKLVGFGDDLIDVATVASEEELRRIIKNAVYFWFNRTQDEGLVAALRCVTGNRFKIRDYFDFRNLVGEQQIMEELENLDSYALTVETINRFAQGTDAEVSAVTGKIIQFESPTIDTSTLDVGDFIVIFDDTGSPSNDGIYKIISIVGINTVYVTPEFARQALSMSWYVAFPYNEYLTEIRVVDELTGEGEVNRELLDKLLELQRPTSERFNVVYVDFMDLFQTKGDTSQWDYVVATGFFQNATFTVDDGYLYFASSNVNAIVANRPSSSSWTDYTFKVKLSLENVTIANAFRLIFLYVDEDNYYFLTIRDLGFANWTVTLIKREGGSNLVLDWDYFPPLSEDVPWTYTINVYRNHSPDQEEIQVLVEGNELLSANVATPTWDSGNIGFYTFLGAAVKVYELELWQYPLTIERVGPNP